MTPSFSASMSCPVSIYPVAVSRSHRVTHHVTPPATLELPSWLRAVAWPREGVHLGIATMFELSIEDNDRPQVTSKICSPRTTAGNS